MTSVDRIQGLSGSIAVKVPCRVATTVAITLSGEQTIDGIAVVEGDRVLVKNQSSSADNGIYEASTGGWTRTQDFDGSNDVVNGTLVYVAFGTGGADLLYRVSGTDPIVPGSSAVTFTLSTSGSSFSAYILTLLDDTSAAEARATLGLGTAATTAATAYQPVDATLTAMAALALTQGSLLTATGADAPAVLAKGTALQQLRMNTGATAPEWFTDTATHTLATPQAATSGTAIDFTGIPAGVKRITVMGVAVSLSGTDTIIVQLGDSGGFETSGYSGGYSSGITPTASATGFAVQDSTAANAYNFKLAIDLESASGFTWVATGASHDTGATQAPRYTNGAKSLTAELTQLRVTSTGASTFDAGAINISYEG